MGGRQLNRTLCCDVPLVRKAAESRPCKYSNEWMRSVLSKKLSSSVKSKNGREKKQQTPCIICCFFPGPHRFN